MVKIILKNQDPNSTDKKVIVDLSTGTCLVNDERSISLSAFKNMPFSHPLIKQKGLDLVNGVYSYTYADHNGFLETSRLVYATLLNAENPKNCRFKIAPLKPYARVKKKYEFFISTDYKKQAKETIDVNQLNQLVQEAYIQPFQYLDIFVIEQDFSFDMLPKEIDGDSLFYIDPEMNKRLTEPEDLHKFELRYINRTMGMGVYAREKFKNDELVVVYYGSKVITRPAITNYYFMPNVDILCMGTDSKYMGNIARFINHAPPEDSSSNDEKLLVANLIPRGYLLNGIFIHGYVTTRAIEKGEQLLVNYGDIAFAKSPALRFDARKDSLDEHNKVIKETFDDKAFVLRAMVHSGMKSALFPLYKRLIFVVLLFFLLCLYFS